MADGVETIYEAAGSDRELGEALVSENEPVVPSVRVIEHTRAADVPNADCGGRIFVEVETRRAATRRHLVEATSQIKVTVADPSDILITTVGGGEKTNGTGRLIIDGDGTHGLRTTHGPQVDIPRDIDGRSEGAESVIEEGSGDGTRVRPR